MLRFFRASRSIQVGTPEVRARSPFSRGRALARSPIGRMRHPVYTKSRLSAAAESLLFGICIRKRYSISLKRPSGPRRFCAVQVFWPKAKTLAQGEFTSPEHFNHRRVERPTGAKPKRKCDLSKQVAFSFGTPEGTRTPSLQNRNLTLYPIALRARLTRDHQRARLL